MGIEWQTGSSEGTEQVALEGEESWREVVKEKNAGKELVGKHERG